MTLEEVKASVILGLKEDISNMKDDMLKMMDKLDEHDMFFEQLNWKIGNRIKLVPGGEGTHQEDAEAPTWEELKALSELPNCS